MPDATAVLINKKKVPEQILHDIAPKIFAFLKDVIVNGNDPVTDLQNIKKFCQNNSIAPENFIINKLNDHKLLVEQNKMINYANDICDAIIIEDGGINSIARNIIDKVEDVE